MMLKWILAVMLTGTMAAAMAGCGERQPEQPEAVPAEPEPGSPPETAPPPPEPGS